MAERRLAYLYVGSADVGRDVDFYRGLLGAELVWRHESFGTEVAAVRLGTGPLVLLAGHRPAPGVIQIWEVEDLDEALAGLRERGWSGPETRVEVPDGPCLLLEDPSGNEIGLLQPVRPGLLERRENR
jgi:catechol 2,3-dioxygenase-like lactoylglutathione lyase family enzyme